MFDSKLYFLSIIYNKQSCNDLFYCQKGLINDKFLRKLNNLTPVMDGESELLSAMKLIADQGQGPKEQVSSMGCNIKWK